MKSSSLLLLFYKSIIGADPSGGVSRFLGHCCLSGSILVDLVAGRPACLPATKGAEGAKRLERIPGAVFGSFGRRL